jgi:hypothetical protein
MKGLWMLKLIGGYVDIVATPEFGVIHVEIELDGYTRRLGATHD